MRKKSISALFMGLLLLSTFVGTVSAFWWERPEPDLPSDVVPYTVTIDSIYIENWWGEPAYYKGVYTIKLTAEVFVITGMTQSILEISASSLSGNNLVTYSPVIIVPGLPPITPDLIEDPEVQYMLHELLGDPTILPDITLQMVAMEATDVVTTDFACVPYPDAVTITADKMTLENYDIDKGTYDGTRTTEMTGDITVKDQVISVKDGCTYSLSGPSAVMDNSVGHATSVRGWALGFIYESWTGDRIPLLVRLAKLLFRTIFMTYVTMKIVSLTADTAVMSTMKVDISA